MHLVCWVLGYMSEFGVGAMSFGLRSSQADDVPLQCIGWKIWCPRCTIRLFWFLNRLAFRQPRLAAGAIQRVRGPHEGCILWILLILRCIIVAVSFGCCSLVEAFRIRGWLTRAFSPWEEIELTCRHRLAQRHALIIQWPFCVCCTEVRRDVINSLSFLVHRITRGPQNRVHRRSAWRGHTFHLHQRILSEHSHAHTSSRRCISAGD